MVKTFKQFIFEEEEFDEETAYRDKLFGENGALQILLTTILRNDPPDKEGDMELGNVMDLPDSPPVEIGKFKEIIKTYANSIEELQTLPVDELKAFVADLTTEFPGFTAK